MTRTETITRNTNISVGVLLGIFGVFSGVFWAAMDMRHQFSELRAEVGGMAVTLREMKDAMKDDSVRLRAVETLLAEHAARIRALEEKR